MIWLEKQEPNQSLYRRGKPLEINGRGTILISQQTKKTKDGGRSEFGKNLKDQSRMDLDLLHRLTKEYLNMKIPKRPN